MSTNIIISKVTDFNEISFEDCWEQSRIALVLVFGVQKLVVNKGLHSVFWTSTHVSFNFYFIW